MPKRYERLLTALADPTRRSIYERIVVRPLTVGELTAKMAISQPAVSQHLKVLREAGLVRVKPMGTRRIYWADPTALRDLQSYLDGLWSNVMDAFVKYNAPPDGNGA